MKHKDVKRKLFRETSIESQSSIPRLLFTARWGPGLIESVYEACLIHKLHLKGLKTERQGTVSVVYRNLRLDAGLGLDMVVERSVVVELKAVKTILPVHKAQLLTYLKPRG
jgi:GxxExxY protein